MVIAKGEQMLASEVLNLAFFPKGTILMYTATGWKDDDTLKGWYACTSARTINGVAIPDLTDKFIRGGTPSTIASTGGGTATLNTTNLPAHTHTGPVHTHSATGLTTDTAGTHTHTVSMKISGSSRNEYFAGWGSNGDWNDDENVWGTRWSAPFSASTAPNHTHAVFGNTASAGNGDTGSVGNGVAFDVIPKYYSVIYIIKVSNAGYDTV